MKIFMAILLVFLLVCAVAVSFNRNLLNSVLIFMSYSVIMSIIWVIIESPDLAITEAAVGAGVTSLLFFLTLKRIEKIGDQEADRADIEGLELEEEKEKEGGESS